MIPLKQTDSLAAAHLAKFVRPIALGSPAHLFSALDHDSRPIDLRDDCFAGWPLLLVFACSLEGSDAQQVLRNLAGSSVVSNGEIKVVVVAAETSASANRQARAQLGLPFPVVSDSAGGLSAAYGLYKDGLSFSPTPVRIVALTVLRQIRAFWDFPTMTNATDFANAFHTDAKLTDIASWGAPHAPVLIAPQVLTREECASLIREFETRGPLRIDRPGRGEEPGGYKIPSYEHGRQDRVDHMLANPTLVQFLDQRFQERLLPLVLQAFSFAVTRREDFHIARYSGERRGHEIGHRDNRTATTHRRFALSLNLNDDYEGGGVVFREFSSRPYKNPAGSALIFSSSLLHEVEETTRGVRYTLISHLFDDSSLQNPRKP